MNFIDREISPHVKEWEEAHDDPRELHKIVYDYGVLGAPPEGGEYAAFHDFISIDCKLYLLMRAKKKR